MLAISKHSRIVVGYRSAIAYNFQSERAFKFDKALARHLLNLLPSVKADLITAVLKIRLVAPPENSAIEGLLDDLLNLGILESCGPATTQASHSEFPTPLLRTLVLEINTRCNFNCQHCYLGDSLKSGEQLDLDVIRKLLDDASSLKIDRVQLTGGNPALHPDVIGSLDLLRDYPYEVFFFSNGTGLSTPLLQALKAANAAVHVSVYGMSNNSGQAFTRYESYFDTLNRTLQSLEDYDIRLRSLDYMVVDENQGEIDNFIAMCKAHGYHYRFGSVVQVGNAVRNKVKNHRETTSLLEPFLENEAAPRFRRMSCYVDQPVVLASGNVTFCLAANEHFDDFILGNIHESSLGSIWMGARTVNIRNSVGVDSLPVCGNCEFKYLCGGVCPFSRKFREVGVRADGTPDCGTYDNNSWFSDSEESPELLMP